MTSERIRTALWLHKSGNLSEAARLYGEILRSEPGNFDALYLLGVLHLQRGDFADAERLFGEALRFHPMSLDALYARASALMRLKRYGQALILFERLLTLNPAIAEAWANQGKTLLDMQRYADAIASFDKALALGDGHADITWTNRGVALWRLGRSEEALESYERSLAIKTNAATLNNRADVLCDLKRFEEAAATYEKLLALEPHFRYARGNLAFCRLQCCDWSSLQSDREEISADLHRGIPAVQPGMWLALSYSPEDQLRCARMWAANEVPAPEKPMWHRQRYRHKRIRVVYLSADFQMHPVSQLMVGVFEHHDKARFETVAISLGVDDKTAFRRRVAAAFDHFIDARAQDDFEIARHLKGMDVDIATDLMGFTGKRSSNILSHRPAPVQVQYLGFPGTMGHAAIDYILADRIVIPEGHQIHYGEKVVYLPDCYMPNDAREIAEPITRAEAGLPESGFVFCSFNNSHKFSPEMFDVWMRLLQALPGSVLWLAHHLAAADNLRRAVEARGVAPERLVFAPYMPAPQNHLARLRLADLFLDTLPYNAHATASDALWAGLPVLTCLGSTFPGRVAASLLHAVGLPEMVTHSLEDYEALALRLARDPAALFSARKKLAGNRDSCALFDTARFTLGLEAAYRTMLERAHRGQPPAAFAADRSA